MARKHKPRSGSLAFYPRKRAKAEKPTMNSFKREGGEVKPLNFYGYKAGMTHIISTDQHKKSPSYGQKVQCPVTLIECPPIKIVGLRAYSAEQDGLEAFTEHWEKNLPKELIKARPSLKQKGKKEKKKGEKALEKIQKKLSELKEIRLIGCMQPWLTGIGKKKPEIVEIFLDGETEKQFEFSQKFLGKELLPKDVFEENKFLDVCGVTKGKGFSGVIKRFGVKKHRPKAKKQRVVGSIGPWHPATVMFTVGRPGQKGYQTRTEHNKKLLKIGSDKEINPKSGFKNYGVIKNNYLMIEGSVPGPVKRCIAIREGIRPKPLEKHKIEEVEYIASKEQ